MKSGPHGNRWLQSREQGRGSRPPEARLWEAGVRPSVPQDRECGEERGPLGEKAGALTERTGWGRQSREGSPGSQPSDGLGTLHLSICVVRPPVTKGANPCLSHVLVVEKVGVSCQLFAVGPLVPGCLPLTPSRCTLTWERGARKRNWEKPKAEGKWGRRREGGGEQAAGWGSIYKGCEACQPAGQESVESPQQIPAPGTPQALVSPAPLRAPPAPVSDLG